MHNRERESSCASPAAVCKLSPRFDSCGKSACSAGFPRILECALSACSLLTFPALLLLYKTHCLRSDQLAEELWEGELAGLKVCCKLKHANQGGCLPAAQLLDVGDARVKHSRLRVQ